VTASKPAGPRACRRTPTVMGREAHVTAEKVPVRTPVEGMQGLARKLLGLWKGPVLRTGMNN